MRRLVVSLVVAGGLTVAAAAPAGAQPPTVVFLPEQACNQGTARAHQAAPAHSRGHPHIPHRMGRCMTMPAGHP